MKWTVNHLKELLTYAQNNRVHGIYSCKAVRDLFSAGLISQHVHRGRVGFSLSKQGRMALAYWRLCTGANERQLGQLIHGGNANLKHDCARWMNEGERDGRF